MPHFVTSDDLRRFFKRLWTPSESKHLTVLAVIVGAAAGVAASLFIKLIEHVQLWVSLLGEWHASPWSKSLLIIAPGLGGLVAGWLVQRFASEHRGTATA